MAYRENNEWNYKIFEGKTDKIKYDLHRINPKLSENLYDYYISWDDKTTCPLKILAYEINIDEYNTVSVDLIVKNTSKKVIAAFKGMFLMFDKMNHPVTWGGSENRFNFLCQNEPVPALSPETQIGSWPLRLYENTRKIKPSITEIQFEDGTKWVPVKKK